MSFFAILIALLLEQARLPGEAVQITNVTAARGVLVLSGPRSRDVLAKLTQSDLSNAGFRWLSGQETEVAGIPLLALRVSYVGELGWELYIPTEFTAHVFEVLQEAGKAFGLTPITASTATASSSRWPPPGKAWKPRASCRPKASTAISP